MERVYFPIWERTEMTIGGDVPFVDYRIDEYLDGVKKSTIFEGRAYKKPDETEVDITINEVLGNRFDVDAKHLIRILTTNYRGLGKLSSDIRNTYYHIVSSDGTDFEVQPIWDYTYEQTPEYPLDAIANRILTRPLRKDGRVILDRKQMLITSQQSEKIVEAYYRSGFDNYPSNNLASGDIFIDLSANDDLRDGVEYVSPLGTFKYDVIDSCCDYCLHYVNKLGGWDSILLNGKNFNREVYDRKIINGRENREVYYTNVEKEWELSCVLMTDKQGLSLSEIVGSQKLILEDLDEDVLYNNPAERFKEVMMVTDSVEQKDYDRNGNQFVSLNVQVREVLPRVRR